MIIYEPASIFHNGILMNVVHVGISLVCGA